MQRPHTSIQVERGRKILVGVYAYKWVDMTISARNNLGDPRGSMRRQESPECTSVDLDILLLLLYNHSFSFLDRI